ncbi:hypothetical protein D3C79_934840 [compost metagenome]
MPAHALTAQGVLHRHLDVIEEDFGKTRQAIELRDRPYTDTGGVERQQDEGQAMVALGVGVGAKDAEHPISPDRPGRPGFLAVDHIVIADPLGL